MDDDKRPIRQLSWAEVATGFDDERSFNIVGGAAVGLALFEHVPGWMFEDPNGGSEEVRPWRGNQGFFCERKNVVTDMATVLRLTEAYFLTGDYGEMRRACAP